MARTELAVTELAPNGAIDAPAGVAGTADGHFVSGEHFNGPGAQPEELVLEVTVATAATDVTVVGGAYPPSIAAGQGDAVFTLATGSHRLGPFESGRFTQADGTLHVDYETAANVTIAAVHVPRGV